MAKKYIISTAVNLLDSNNFQRMKAYAVEYKPAASWAARLVLDEQNYNFVGDGMPSWNGIDVYDENGYELANMENSGRLTWNSVVDGMPAYAEIQYIITAMQNARNQIRATAMEWVTPAQMERELNLKSGTIRQYIFNHRDSLLERNVIQQADERTVLLRRGFALATWGKRGEKRYQDMEALEQIFDLTSDAAHGDREYALRPEYADAVKQQKQVSGQVYIGEWVSVYERNGATLVKLNEFSSNSGKVVQAIKALI